jgi:phosphatidate cytidylyltransferase
MNNKLQRIITALILAPIVLVAIVVSSPLIFLLVSIFIIMIASFEFFNMLNVSGNKFIFFPAFLSSLLLPVGFYISFEILTFFVVLIFLLTLIIQLFSKRPLEDTFKNISNTLLTAFYVPILFSFLVLFKKEDWHYIFLLMFIIWSSDTGAYFFGIKYGKNRLYETISPKKSVEGLVAGIVSGVIFSLIYCKLFTEISVFHSIIAGALVSVFGVVGDLVESMFKRFSGIKDSGNIIPGHGGLLDRIDSLLFGAPVLYFYLNIFVL